MATYNVSTAAQFNTALAAARGGDTINLAPGNYGAGSVRNIRPDAMLTIKSADAANPAHFDTLTVHASQNLTFRGLDIGRALAAGEADFTQLSAVRSSSRIVFDGNYIHGGLDGNATNDGYGLLVDGVTALTLTNNVFKELTRGAIVSDTTNALVAHNKFFDMRSDGLNADGVRNMVIEHNLFQGFYPNVPHDHPDAIQIHNVGYTFATENVTIRNNVMLPGGDYSPQGIWIAGGGTHGFRNMLIENNLMYGEGSYNGIGVDQTVGAIVRGNTILSPTTDNKTMWIRLSNSNDILLEDNVAEDFIIAANVTNLRQVDNVNLRTSPALRQQMTDFDTPDSVDDLIVAQVGFQLPTLVSGEAPVSSVVGSALRDMADPNTGQSLDVARVADMLGQRLAVSDAPEFHPEPADLAFEAPAWFPAGGPEPFSGWWTALP